MSVRGILAVAAAITLAPASPAPAQGGPMNAELGLLMHGFRVQVRATGVDSTAWFTGRITQTRQGCTYIEIEDGRWVGGALVPDSAVPPRERLLTPVFRLRRVEAHPVHGSDEWREVAVERLAAGEPAACRAPARR